MYTERDVGFSSQAAGSRYLVGLTGAGMSWSSSHPSSGAQDRMSPYNASSRREGRSAKQNRAEAPIAQPRRLPRPPPHPEIVADPIEPPFLPAAGRADDSDPAILLHQNREELQVSRVVPHGSLGLCSLQPLLPECGRSHLISCIALSCADARGCASPLPANESLPASRHSRIGKIDTLPAMAPVDDGHTGPLPTAYIDAAATDRHHPVWLWLASTSIAPTHLLMFLRSRKERKREEGKTGDGGASAVHPGRPTSSFPLGVRRPPSPIFCPHV